MSDLKNMGEQYRCRRWENSTSPDFHRDLKNKNMYTYCLAQEFFDLSEIVSSSGTAFHRDNLFSPSRARSGEGAPPSGELRVHVEQPVRNRMLHVGHQAVPLAPRWTGCGCASERLSCAGYYRGGGILRRNIPVSARSRNTKAWISMQFLRRWWKGVLREKVHRFVLLSGMKMLCSETVGRIISSSTGCDETSRIAIFA